MKAIKHETTYNTLGGCLEAYFGEKRAERSTRREYREPEQGLRTVPFKSLPLQLDHMRRRERSWMGFFKAS